MKLTDVKCKGVHIKLDKETHLNFKLRLARHDLTMQDAFEEFARQVGLGNLSANNLLEKLIRTRVRAELATVGLTPFSPGRKGRASRELNPDMLYDLISEGDEADEDR